MVSNNDNRPQSGNEADAIYAGARLVYLRNHFAFTHEELALSGLLNIIPQFLPSSYYPEYVVLSNAKREVAQTPGGGFIWGYGFSWFGQSGTILLSLIISFLLVFSDGKSTFSRAIGLVFFSTIPRWIAYSPLVMFKISFIVLIFFVIIYITSYLLHTKKVS